MHDYAAAEPLLCLNAQLQAQNLGRAFYHLRRVAGTGPGLIALRVNGFIFVWEEWLSLFDTRWERPHLESQAPRT